MRENKKKRRNDFAKNKNVSRRNVRDTHTAVRWVELRSMNAKVNWWKKSGLLSQCVCMLHQYEVDDVQHTACVFYAKNHAIFIAISYENKKPPNKTAPKWLQTKDKWKTINSHENDENVKSNRHTHSLWHTNVWRRKSFVQITASDHLENWTIVHLNLCKINIGREREREDKNKRSLVLILVAPTRWTTTIEQ